MKFKTDLVKLLLCVLLAAFFMGGCIKGIKEDTPIVPIVEYEKMLLGKITSDYVGDVNCLKGCHTHDKIALDFKSSTMGDQLKEASHGMKIVDCESCHGPASEAMEAMEGLDEKKDARKILKAHTDNLLRLNELPAGALSLICLKCHTTNATFNIHNWNGGVHAANDVSCSACHPIHAGSDLILEPRSIASQCLNCHLDVAAQFSMPSRHAVKEGKIYCTDCHNPHGTENEFQLTAMTQRETCGRCHTEKTGPFLYEHADNTENCSTCHSPHGSPNNNLLKIAQPFLCKQCHSEHDIPGAKLTPDDYSGLTEPERLARLGHQFRCTDCHAMIHGSDTPGEHEPGAMSR
jgi:DmsE family decaheme c-type cytochrome